MLSFSSCAPKSQGIDSFESFSQNLKLEQTENCNEDCTDLKREFKYLVYVSEKIYCYWDEKQKEYSINFKEIAAGLENQITNSTTETQYFQLLTKWAASFRDGHVNAMLRDDLSKLEFYEVPVRFEVLAPGTDHETLIVSRTGSSVQSLKPGTVVNKIQGKNWKEYADEAEKLSSGSTKAMRRRSVGNNIFQVLAEIEGPKPILIEGIYNGKKISENIPRNIELYDGAIEARGAPETGLNLLKTVILPSNIGYLKIDGFQGTKMTQLLNQAMDRLSTTDGLILDLRKNGGGDLSGNAILSRLANQPMLRFKQKAVAADYLTAARPSVVFEYNFNQGDRFSEILDRNIAPAAESKRYSKPVIVLTSSYCFSACDTFVSAMKENKLALIVGEATGGGSGNPLAFELPVSEHAFRYSVVQGFTAVSNTLIEGAGTQPDVIIEPTVDERVQAKDLQLEKALQLIVAKLSNPNEKISMFATNVKLPNELLLTTDSKIKYKFIEVEKDKEIRKSGD